MNTLKYSQRSRGICSIDKVYTVEKQKQWLWGDYEKLILATSGITSLPINLKAFRRHDHKERCPLFEGYGDSSTVGVRQSEGKMTFRTELYAKSIMQEAKFIYMTDTH